MTHLLLVLLLLRAARSATSLVDAIAWTFGADAQLHAAVAIAQPEVVCPPTRQRSRCSNLNGSAASVSC
jgi:hypothetical protein